MPMPGTLGDALVASRFGQPAAMRESNAGDHEGRPDAAFFTGNA